MKKGRIIFERLTTSLIPRFLTKMKVEDHGMTVLKDWK